MAEKQKTEKADAGQVIFLRGNSRGAEHNARRTVDAAMAARLVRDGLARYPASKA